MSLNHDSPDHLVVILSDIEMGAGGRHDDFPHTEWLAELILRYSRPPYTKYTVDLVFNGDTFDLLKTSIDGAFPRRITAGIAVGKLERVIAAHGPFFAALRSFVMSSDRGVHFIAGNHDLELAFPEVRQRIEVAIGTRGISFPGLAMRIGDLHIEHGMQADGMFETDPGALLIEHDGEQILNLPWGATALIDVALPLQPQLGPLDRLKPRELGIDLLPEVRDLLVGAFYRYWTRDWWQAYWSGDPTRRISWTMLKEVVYRFGTQNIGLDVGNRYRQYVMRDDGPRVAVIGHLHQAGWWSWCDRKVLYSGCLRDEYRLLPDGTVGDTLPKQYVEAWLCGERVTRASLVEVVGPPPVPGHMPHNISELLPDVLPLLGSVASRRRLAREQKEQEHKEAKEAKEAKSS